MTTANEKLISILGNIDNNLVKVVDSLKKESLPDTSVQAPEYESRDEGYSTRLAQPPEPPAAPQFECIKEGDVKRPGDRSGVKGNSDAAASKPSLNSLGLVRLDAIRPRPGTLVRVTCQCGVVGLIDERWHKYASRLYRIGARMYFELPNKWCVQTIPHTDPEVYVCPHCMFTRAYEVLGAVRHSLEKHGEFIDIVKKEYDQSESISEADNGCEGEGQGTPRENGSNTD